MNLLHMKYAVEVARIGSINKASEALLIAQPNLSRAVKELEEELGIVIFNRSAKGMTLTQSGEEFIFRAEKILEKINEVEELYKAPQKRVERLSVCGITPHYALRAFSHICSHGENTECEKSYELRSVADTVNAVGRGEYRLGIVGVSADCERRFEVFSAERGLKYERVARYRLVMLANRRGRIALSRGEDMSGAVRAAYTGAFGEKDENECVFKVDSALACLELLSANDEIYAYSPPMPEKLLKAYGICEVCVATDKIRCDGLVYKNGMHFNTWERLFFDELVRTKI